MRAAAHLLAVLLLAAAGYAVAREKHLIDPTPPGSLNPRSELEAIAASWHAWGQDPDALWCFSHTDMVAQKR